MVACSWPALLLLAAHLLFLSDRDNMSALAVNAVRQVAGKKISEKINHNSSVSRGH